MVLAVIALAIGWSQGLLRPIAAELAFLTAVAIVALVRAPLLALIAPRIDLPPDLILVVCAIGLAFLLNVPAGRLAARIKLTRLGGADRLLGVALQGLTALAIAFLLLLTSAHADRAVRPLLAGGPARPITPAQVDAFAAGVHRDRILNSIVLPAQLSADRAYAGTGHLTLDLLEKQHPWVRAYLGFRPALLSSQLAPVVLRYGQRLPLLGPWATTT